MGTHVRCFYALGKLSVFHVCVVRLVYHPHTFSACGLLSLRTILVCLGVSSQNSPKCLTLGLLSLRAILLCLGSLFGGYFGVWESIFDNFFIILGCWRALGHPPGSHLASKAKKERKKSKKRVPNGDLLGPLRSIWVTWGSIWGSWGPKRASQRCPRVILWTL